MTSRDVIDAGDEEQVGKAKKLEKSERHGEILAMRDLLETEAGRITLWRILSRCGVFQSGFSESHAVMAHHSGGRDIGLWLISEITAASGTAFMDLQREALRRGEKELGVPEDV